MIYHFSEEDDSAIGTILFLFRFLMRGKSLSTQSVDRFKSDYIIRGLQLRCKVVKEDDPQHTHLYKAGKMEAES